MGENIERYGMLVTGTSQINLAGPESIRNENFLLNRKALAP